jgi:hypothetical protein
MNKIQHQALKSGELDLLFEEPPKGQVEFIDLQSTLEQLAAVYIGFINEKMDEKDVSSSGKMQTSIKASEVTQTGNTYEIGIFAPDYASYQDEGVNGWAVNRGSRFQFRTKGVSADMLKSVKDWLQREGKSARNVKVGISKREVRGMDALSQRANTAAFMIKRQGLKPTHFWKEATDDLNRYFEEEVGNAIKVDIVNNILP